MPQHLTDRRVVQRGGDRMVAMREAGDAVTVPARMLTGSLS
ncbi:hypothetical protein [Kineosporia mesophila]|nr:hypothetical protein [Kineosporia mesophila]